jgi:RNA polymerase sigma-70 factor (ECF subfamily)
LQQTISGARFAELLTDLLPPATGYARSILRNKADAEDAVQQAALRGLKALADYDPSRSFKAWWFMILHHCCIDLLRTRRPGEPFDPAAIAAKSPSQQTEDWEELSLAFDRLSPEHADILRLRYFSEMSYRDLAEALGIPRGTVMSRLHAARLRLAAQLQRIQS